MPSSFKQCYKVVTLFSAIKPKLANNFFWPKFLKIFCVPYSVTIYEFGLEFTVSQNCFLCDYFSTNKEQCLKIKVFRCVYKTNNMLCVYICWLLIKPFVSIKDNF